MVRSRQPLFLFAPFLTATLLVALLITPSVSAEDLEAQRSLFLQAEQALEKGASDRYERLRKRLVDYPLAPYLDFQALLKRLDEARPAEIRDFTKEYADTPLADRLLAAWLNRLAKRGAWQDYLAFYQPTSNISRRCHQLHALIVTGRAQEALPRVEEIWLHGKSRPRACDPVFAAWEKAGYRTDALNWQRIALAMEAGEWRLAEYLGRKLSNADRIWLKRWTRLHRNPRHATEHKRYSEPHPYREAMLSHAVRRLARWDGLDALTTWKSIKHRYSFSTAQIERTEHYIARNLVRETTGEAYSFVRGIEIDNGDLKVHEARILAALLREDWSQLVKWIGALPCEERQSERWRYWLARALERVGEHDASQRLFAKVAEERSYYGFLAADRLDVDYHLAHAETPASNEYMAQISALPGVQRARELFALERWTDGRREWREGTRHMDKLQLKAAAKIAKRNGWHDRAIFTLARTGYWDDLELRFPLEHAKLVKENARRHGIDIAWVFAVMRQESAFMDNARSHAGAIGLMQLMPATARSVARKVLKRKPPRRSELLEPETNIALGSAYLKQVKGKLGDSSVLATAAYNAGPHRVTRWLPPRTLPADIWIELVPFRETRGYLQRVLTYTVIYEKRMGREPTRLRERMHPVPPSLSLVGEMVTRNSGATG